MKTRIWLGALTLAALLSACQNDESGLEQKQDRKVAVKFGAPSWGIAAGTRVANDAFEAGDRLSISAVKNDTTTTGDVLLAGGNYADNYRYQSNGLWFLSADTIWQHHSVPLDLVYYVVYPARDELQPSFTFTAAYDQSSAAKYAASDLCMQKLATRSDTIELALKHMLSCIEVDFRGNGVDKIGSVAIKDLFTQVVANQNTQTVSTNEVYPVGSRTVYPYEFLTTATERKFRALVAPQTINQDVLLMNFTVAGETGTREFRCPNTLTLKSGQRLRLEYTVENEGGTVVLTYGGEEVEESHVDARIDLRPRKR